MIMKTQSKVKKICLISSSGGHFEQLKMLTPLSEKYKICWITERTKYKSNADYFLIQTGSKDVLFPLKMFLNSIKSLLVFIKFRPNFVITTGTMIVIPMAFLAKIFRKKLIYIETFARIHDGTKTGKLMYKYSDLFIVQWEELLKIYPNAIYGGSIY